MEKSYLKGKNVTKMVIFTLIGVLYYMVPFKLNGDMTMAIAVIEDAILEHVTMMPAIMMYIMVVTGIISLLCSTVFRGKLKNEFLASIFETNALGLLFRLGGAFVAFLAYYKLGPEFIWNEYTGQIIVQFLMPALLVLFAAALLFIGLLTDYGGLELLGGVLQPVFKPLFGLSGKASVMSLVSYIGSGTTGMILTDSAHKRKEFSTRDGNVIVFIFAIISFPVTFVYPTGLGGLEVQYFPALALCLVLCTVITGVILTRIPPLSRKSKTYIDGEDAVEEKDPEGRSRLRKAYEDALQKAESAPSFFSLMKEGLKEFVGLVVEIFPLITLIAILVLGISEYTPIFDILAIPFAPILNAMGLPEATAAAPNFFIGFADLILPFLGAAGVTSQLTKFVICVVAIVQVYCMSEGVIVLLRSSLNIKFSDIVIVFILKTIISIPIAYYFGMLMGVPA